MFARIVTNFKKSYIEYSLYFLIGSLFFGNALLSVANAFIYIILLFSIYGKIISSEFFQIKPFLFFNLYFIANFIILCFVSDSFGQVLVIEKHLPFVVFPLFFFVNRNLLNTTRIINNIRKIFIVSALLTFIVSFFYSLWRMFFFEEKINSVYITYNFLTDLFGVHQIYLSVFFVLAILFCIDFYFEDVKVRNKKFIFIAVLLFIAVILLSSRTGMIATFIIVSIKIVLLNKNKVKEIVIVFFSIVLLGGLLTFSIPTLKKRVVNINKNVSSYSGASFRFKVWENAFVVFKESPIYGYGLKKSQKNLLNQYYKVNFRRAYLKNLNTHNQYLQTLIDSGIIGFVSLIAMLFSPFFYFRKKTNLMLFSIVILITSITESFLIRQNGIIFYTLFFCILAMEQDNLVSPILDS